MTNQTSVRVDLQYTRNLGNYENIKIGIAIEDFKRQGESTDEATERIYKFVEAKLIEKVNEVEGELKGKK
jgi:argininosuccinate lyase